MDSILTILGFLIVIIGCGAIFYEIWYRVQKGKEEKRMFEDLKELFDDMLLTPKEFKVGQKIPFSGGAKFGGFVQDQICILTPGWREYTPQHYNVKIGTELVLEDVTFVVKDLSSEENKIFLQILDE